jgi:hypothetical protein
MASPNNMEMATKAKVMTVVGARPNFMKAAPIIAAIRDHNGRFATSRSTMGRQKCSANS